MFYQVNMESIMRNRELTETRMMQVSSIFFFFFFCWEGEFDFCLHMGCKYFILFLILFLLWVSVSDNVLFRLYGRSWLLQNGGQKRSGQHIMPRKWFIPTVIFIFRNMRLIILSFFPDLPIVSLTTFISVLKQASMEREVELEHRAIESSTALARIQVT